ncbi:MAG: hypothetical protein ACHREM_29240, partial [Polyangiales bacterium]
MRSRARRVGPLALVGTAIAASVASSPDVGAAPARHDRLEISADSAIADGDEIVLEGDVDVRVARGRLRAERLRVTRDARGVSIDGPVVVAPCDADRPAISFEVRHARLDRDGDLTIEDARVRLGGVTVAWLPWLLLRPESAIGLVAPDVGWNAALGGYLSPALRVPIARDGRDSLTIGAVAYVDRAAGLRLAIDAPALAGTVRVDEGGDEARVRGFGLDARLEGVLQSRRGDVDTIAAARVDLLRGARAAASVGALEPRLRPFDQVDLAVAAGPVALSLTGASARGGAIDVIEAKRAVGAWSDGGAIGA